MARQLVNVGKLRRIRQARRRKRQEGHALRRRDDQELVDRLSEVEDLPRLRVRLKQKVTGISPAWHDQLAPHRDLRGESAAGANRAQHGGDLRCLAEKM